MCSELALLEPDIMASGPRAREEDGRDELEEVVEGNYR
jgi:hypothetical protein